jgi:NADH:ubiquinone oxidoreductase subunit 6 (subunit J)
VAFAELVFWVLAVVSVAAALGVVLLKDVFRAALLLVAVFLAVAGFYVMLNAEFLAVVQVLIYAGAIAILVIFAIMLTQDVAHGNLSNRLQLPAVLLSVLFLVTVVFVAVETDWNKLENRPELVEKVELVQANTLGGIPEDERLRLGVSKSEAERSNLGDMLMKDYVLAFEVASVLLLASAIGALALVRERRT